MKLQLTYENGSTVTIDCVQSIELKGINQILTNTFGNGPVLHRGVILFAVSYVAEDIRRAA